MTTPNMPDPFFVDIVAIFPGNAWQTNAVNSYVTFQGTGNSTITFLSALNVPIGVTFYLPPTVQVNPIHSFHLFENQYSI